MSNLNEKDLSDREQELNQRLKKIQQMEEDIKNKEKQMKEKEKAKKQVLLRLAPTLWEDLAKWADEEYRSINSQIEFLLAECVRRRKE